MSDYIEQSFSNLARRRLRTFLTTFGVVIGIGALVSMFAFGQGVQKNMTDKFKELELFNCVNVFPPAMQEQPQPKPALPIRDGRAMSAVEGTEENPQQAQVLDDDLIQRIGKIEGVESAFAEIRFPAMVRLREKETFSLVQVLPANVCQAGLVKLLVAGKPYASDDANSLIISDSLLHGMKIKDAKTVVGEQVELSTLRFDPNLFSPAAIASIVQGDEIPFSRESYTFTIVGVAERMGFGGFMPVRSDVFIPPGPSEKMKKISLTSIWDFFSAADTPGQAKGYPMVTVKLSSAKYVQPVKQQVEDWGFKTFALIDELNQIKRAFIFMDMFLFAVAMIAITVASLGIINTMVMSILERYKEIGIMKAVGASDKDVKKIFFFESGVIGFLGGVFGLALGWAVSVVINRVANYFLAKQGVPYTDYFSFPWWLCLGAVAFSIVVSLAAGIYPTLRAARVDPVVALRHD
jgi:putative ABC transport system permease protein